MTIKTNTNFVCPESLCFIFSNSFIWHIYLKQFTMKGHNLVELSGIWTHDLCVASTAAHA